MGAHRIRRRLAAAATASALTGSLSVVTSGPAAATLEVFGQQAYVKASNTGTNDFFGYSVAISGDTMVVAADGESSNATGVGGTQGDNSASGSGAAYVFIRTGGTWTQQAYLKASNTDADDDFGSSIAISGDTIVVGAIGEDSNATGVGGTQSDNSASSSGAAYVFIRTGGTWTQQAYLKASNTDASDLFGSSVAVSGDTIVVGAVGEDSNATGVGGTQGDNSASGSGAAYVFTRTGTVWTQQAYLKASNTDASDGFGSSVTISGDTIVAGADGEGSNATGVGGTQSDNSAPSSGAAYVFTRSGGTWTQQAYLKASNTDTGDNFGFPVAISGDTVVVGAVGEDSNATGVGGTQSDNSASGSGAAYVYIRSGGTWSQQAYLKASNAAANDQFGWAVAIDGEISVVGAYAEDSAATGVGGDQADDSASGSGAAYSFTRSGVSWAPQAYLKASNTGAYDSFGHALAISGGSVVAGANGEDSSATGVGGNQTDNGMSNGGAAYVFVLGPPAATAEPLSYWKAATLGTPPLPVSLGAYTVDSQSKARAVFKATNCGRNPSDAVACLAGHLLVAKLNVASGVPSGCITAGVAAADTFLTAPAAGVVNYTGPGSYTLTKAQRKNAIALMGALADFSSVGCP